MHFFIFEDHPFMQSKLKLFENLWFVVDKFDARYNQYPNIISKTYVRPLILWLKNFTMLYFTLFIQWFISKYLFQA